MPISFRFITLLLPVVSFIGIPRAYTCCNPPPDGMEIIFPCAPNLPLEVEEDEEVVWREEETPPQPPYPRPPGIPTLDLEGIGNMVFGLGLGAPRQ